jgi:hypothetical protein
MIWLSLGLIGFVVTVGFILFDEWYDLLDKFLMSILALLTAGLLSGGALLLSSGIVTETANIDYVKVDDKEIVALKDNQNVNGHFYLMGGYVNEELYYYYAEETEYGYKTEKVEADNCYIKYTDEQPHIEKYQAEFTSEVAKAFAIAPICDDRYVIYCPENTITNEFKIDLE